jgi:hypothetical protein
LANPLALIHDGAQAAEDTGDQRSVVPVGGVFRGGPFGEVGEGPLLVEPAQFPSDFGVVGPAGA